ncbi:MAG TPA: isocitrate lyase/phosphoenolpyruvate mutase family protein [Rhizomicrobium sp.]|nr:isocitrate lyase/phosphoenolpyruvate mutase family protein [Rhizomicrobium sp.]
MTFAELHQGPDVLVLPNAWDAGSARVIEVAGAKAIATSSAAVAWANGYPDGEALPFELVLATVAEIARVVSVPITADIEAGYAEDGAGAADSVARVLEAGAAGINIEDGTGAPDLLAAKIKAIKARHGAKVWVNARTDVYLHNLAQGEAAYDETIRRARLYRDAGADSIFIPLAVEDVLLVRFVEAIDAPLNFLAWTGLPPLARLKEIGVRRLSAGSGVAKMSLDHTHALTKAFLAEGRSEPLTGPTAFAKGLNAIMRR